METMVANVATKLRPAPCGYMTRADLEAHCITAEESKRRLVSLMNNYFDRK